VLAAAWRERRDETALHRLAGAHMRLVLPWPPAFGITGSPPPIWSRKATSVCSRRRRASNRNGKSVFPPMRRVDSGFDSRLRAAELVDRRGGTSSAQKALFFNLRRLRARLMQGGEAESPGQAFKQSPIRLASRARMSS